MMSTQSNWLTLARTILGVMAVLFGLAVLTAGVRYFWLSRSGRYTQGRVVAKQRITDRRRASDEYRVEYAFRTKEGKVLTAEDNVPPEFWKTLKEGDPITVAYVPSFPLWHSLGGVPEPSEQGWAAFVMALGAAITTWGALKLSKRPRPSQAGIKGQQIPLTTDDLGLATLKAERASRALIKGLLVTTVGALMAGYSYGPRWFAGTRALGADPATDALGLSGIALVALGFPITIIAALFGSGPLSKKRAWRGLAVGLVFVAVSGGWLARHFYRLPPSGRLTWAEAVPVLLAIYWFMVGTAITLAAAFSYATISAIARR